MPLFIPPALYYTGLAALGAGGRFLNSPTGQNVIRSGQKYLDKGLSTIQNYASPLINRAFGTQLNVPIQQQVVPSASQAIPPALLSMYADNPSALITDAGYFSGADDASKLITGEGEWGVGGDLVNASKEIIDAILEDTEEETKKDKKETKKDKKKEKTKDKEEPSLDKDKEEPSLDLVEMKKGGYVKKQRKRKHYRASGFVKMKKKKKRKYV
tara:strand:- start:317 stop:955 length:639 start_codon:yes stop_codon:yes gene_type:complete